LSWWRMDDGFLTHPKALAAGKDGRALFVAGGLYSAGEYTDGRIPAGSLALIAAAADVRPAATARRLVEVGLWHPPGHDCPRCAPCGPGEYVIHDYHDWNPTAEAELEKRRVRADAGRKGGQRSRPPSTKPEANRKQTLPPDRSKPGPNAEADEKLNGTPSPSPSLGDLPTQPTTVGTRPDPADWPGPDPPSPDQPQDPNTLLTAAATLLAVDEMNRRAALGELDNPEGYRRSRITPIRRENEPFWRLLADENPAVTAQQLAAATQQRNTPNASTNSTTSNPLSGQQQALHAATEAGTAKTRAIAAEPPDPETNAARAAALRDALRQQRTPDLGEPTNPTQETPNG